MVEAVESSIEDLPTRPMLKGLVNGGCIVDKMIGKCGPYRYHVTKCKGKQTWKYLGRTDQFTGLVNARVGKHQEGE